MTLTPEILEDLRPLERAERLKYSWHREKVIRELEEIHAEHTIISVEIQDFGARGGCVLAAVANGDWFRVTWPSPVL
jgi:hypothetical protein